jgi:GTP cyclohydrolase IA
MTITASRGAPGIDTAAVEDLYRQLLKALGQDPGSEALRDTPRRAAAFWAEFLYPDAGSADTTFSFEGSGSDLAAVSGIGAWTVCQHHLLPFHVTVAAAYQPAGKIIGLSKIARIVARHAAALQVQEALTHQVATSLAEATGSPAVGVWVTGEHLCMLMRGARASGARASTQTLLGTAATDLAMEHRLHAGAHPGTGGP